MPDTIPPMLAGAGRLPSGDGWAFEFKYDGSPETLICLR
jgi:hypothetical protein